MLRSSWRRALTVALALGLLLGGSVATASTPTPTSTPTSTPTPSGGSHRHAYHGTVQGRLLGDSWKTLLELPGTLEPPDHPYVDGICLTFDGVVSPLVGLNQATKLRCQAPVRQRLFIVGRSYEQSALEQGDPKATYEELLAAATAQLGSTAPTVRFDDEPVRLRKVTSPLVRVRLPRTNLFGTDRKSTRLVAIGWVATMRVPPGRHVITIEQPDGFTTTTTIYGSSA